MKKLCFTLCFVLVALIGTLSAQYPDAKDAITFKWIGVDYYTVQSGYNDTYMDGVTVWSEALDAIDSLNYGVELGYFRNINPYLNVGIPMRFGTVREFYPRSDYDPLTTPRESNRYFISADVVLQLQYFKESNFVNPYIQAGIGAFKLEGENLDLYAPLAAGLNFRLARHFYLQLQTEYRFAFKNDNNFDHMVHSAGFKFILGDGAAEEEVVPPPPPPPSDRDGDGVIDNEDECPDVVGLAKFAGCPDTDGDDIQDSEDECPDVVGLAKFAGCPDTDGDGIQDSEDECPEEAGPESNKGCPVSDKDGDGVNDDEDKCPDTPGLVKFDGCPDSDGDGVVDSADKCPTVAGLSKFAGCPDTDGDGVQDSEDKCITKAGPASNQGCPELEKEDKDMLDFAVKNVEFETGKNALTSDSKEILDKVADIMAKYPNYSLRISGHTDNVGKEDSNQQLSERRAKSCRDYLVSKGVSESRMSYAGYGESQPIDDNKTKEGRQNNRRVEFDVYLK